MKTVVMFYVGLALGAVLAYGLQPLPRVAWYADGSIENATFDCVGMLASDTVHVDVKGTLEFRGAWCPGFMREGINIVMPDTVMPAQFKRFPE